MLAAAVTAAGVAGAVALAVPPDRSPDAATIPSSTVLRSGVAAPTSTAAIATGTPTAAPIASVHPGHEHAGDDHDDERGHSDGHADHDHAADDDDHHHQHRHDHDHDHVGDTAVTTAPQPGPVAPLPVVPAGAAPLDVEVAPPTDESLVVTGPEAAAWFDQASVATQALVAANVDVAVDVLAEQFADDPSVFLSADGMVGYTEPALPTADESATGTGDDPPLTSAETQADVFALDSLPSSPRVVYLDFDGHVMDGEYWNSTFSVGRFENQPYDIDGDPASFSTTERARIVEIWQRVADDFAPFDVNVTTRDPGVDGLRRTSTFDSTYGTRTVITSSDWYAAANGGRRIGGIALLNVFTSSTDHASFVFSGNLGGGNAKYVAEAASHEAGHTFSLEHDGTASADYYGGHGSWGPIMGTPYSRAVTHWSDGQYPGADNTDEDDLADIGSRGGLRSDDHGNTAGAATAVTVGTHRGLIGVGGDVDVFRVTPGPHSTRISVTGDVNATNLLARMTVRDADGDVLIAIDPASVTGWALSTVVPASATPFTVEIEATSWMTPSTGFVEYGSMGAYTLDVADLDPATTTTSTSTTSSTTSTTSTSTTSTSTTTTSTTLVPTTAATTTTTTTSPPPPPPTTTPPAPPPPPPTTPPPGPAVSAPNGLALTAIAPQRLVDTRSGLGGQARLAAGGIVRVPVAGRPGIPADARAAVANVTLVSPDAPGFATVYPCTAQVPDVSVLNHLTGQTVANNTIAALSAAGELCVYTSAGADVLVDVTGWLGPSGSSRLVPLGPSRVVDTRSALGGTRRVAAGSTTRFDLSAALPPRSTAIALNLTAVTPSQAGFLTAFPCERGRPDTSSVNFAAGETRPNNAVVATGDGSICVYADTSTDLLIDVTGAFGPNGLGLVPVDPVRLLDTRRTTLVPAAGVRSFSTLGSQLSPLTPRSASVNVTALDQPAAGFVSTFDCTTLRDTSTLNPTPGSVSANGAIVPLGDGDRSCLMSSSGGNLIVDLTGWWVP